MGRHLASNAITLFIAVLLLAGVLIVWGVRQYDAQGPLSQAICLQVERGSTIARVADDLVEQGAISNLFLFRVSVDYAGKERALKAGQFLIPATASMRQIIETITTSGRATCGLEIVYRVGMSRTTALVREVDPTSGRYEEKANFLVEQGTQSAQEYTAAKAQEGTRFRIIIADGITSWRVATALDELDMLSAPSEATEPIPAEGTLAPGSYEVRAGDTRSDLLARMQEVQSARLELAWEERSPSAVLNTPQEALILASIIEKETGKAEERAMVAGVFTNRLRRGMKLQTDPTVIYGITRGKGVLGHGLRRSQLRENTPWNTYVIEGLPPTPIANPGLASIKAALNPAPTEFLYFVADGEG